MRIAHFHRDGNNKKYLFKIDMILQKIGQRKKQCFLTDLTSWQEHSRSISNCLLTQQHPPHQQEDV